MSNTTSGEKSCFYKNRTWIVSLGGALDFRLLILKNVCSEA